MAEKAKDASSKVPKKDGSVASKGSSKVLHVRLDGKTKELALSELPLTPKSTDEEILAVLAKNLRVDIERFSFFTIERKKDGSIYLRPDALFSER